MPTGDVDVTVGTSRIRIPLKSLVRRGPTDATSKWVYVKKLGAVPRLLRFVLDNRGRKFKIVALDPAGSGVPLRRPDGPLSTDLPVRIEAVTTDGLSLCDTTVELKRGKPLARRWRR
jgi:hypothetical protein